MPVKRFNICRPEKYTLNGAEKTKWLQVGEIIQFDDGGLKLTLNHTSEKFMVFAEKPKTAPNGVQPAQTTSYATPTPTPPQIATSQAVDPEIPPMPSEEPVNVEDIPF